MSGILKINEYNDISKISDNTKYINISINKCDNKVIDYFFNNGSRYLYSDSLNNKNGFTYVSYDVFRNGERIITYILNNIPDNLSVLEKIRYIYIKLGKIFNLDINTVPDKNEMLSLKEITDLNNIWLAATKNNVTEISISKIFLYICMRLGIKSEIVNTNINGELANKIYIDDSFIIVNLFKDLQNIKAGFMTEYFDKYNSNRELDKKIGYIEDEYTEYYLNNEFKKINYNDNLLFQVLNITKDIIDVDNISSYDLSIIYQKIFVKYFPNCPLKTNNFYLKSFQNNKEAFLVFNYDNVYYSYNYSKKNFIELDYNYLMDNIKNSKIGLYQDENFDVLKERMVL